MIEILGERYYTPAEVAAMLHMHESSLWRRWKRGLGPATQAGDRALVGRQLDRRDLQAGADLVVLAEAIVAGAHPGLGASERCSHPEPSASMR